MGTPKKIDFSQPVINTAGQVVKILDYVMKNPRSNINNIVENLWDRKSELRLFKQRIHDMKYRGYLNKESDGPTRYDIVYTVPADAAKAYKEGRLHNKHGRTSNKTIGSPAPKEKQPEQQPEQQQQFEFQGSADAALDVVATLIRDNRNMENAIKRIEAILDELKQQQ